MTLCTKYYYNDQIKVNGIGEACSTHMVDDKYIHMLCWKAGIEKSICSKQVEIGG
jgi:hypothetical protein